MNVSVAELLENFMKLTNQEFLIGFILKEKLDPSKRNLTTLRKVKVKDLKDLIKKEITKKGEIDQNLFKVKLSSLIESIHKEKETKKQIEIKEYQEKEKYQAIGIEYNTALKNAIDINIKPGMIGPLLVTYLDDQHRAGHGEGSVYGHTNIDTLGKLIKKTDSNLIIEALEDLNIKYLSLDKLKTLTSLPYEVIGNSLIGEFAWSMEYNPEIRFSLNLSAWHSQLFPEIHKSIRLSQNTLQSFSFIFLTISCNLLHQFINSSIRNLNGYQVSNVTLINYINPTSFVTTMRHNCTTIYPDIL